MKKGRGRRPIGRDVGSRARLGRRVNRGRTFALGTRTVPLSFSTGACASISPMSPVASTSQKVVVAPGSRATVPFPFSSKRAEEGKT